jgi:predicted alpha/beta hydrolase
MGGELFLPPSERETFSVETPSGVRLALERIPARPPVAGAAWVAHAMMANRRSLDRPRGAGFASRLAAAGVEVYLADLRGHGNASAAPLWSYDDIVREDLPALSRFLRARHPDLPIAGVGHSLAAHGALAAEGSAREGPRLDAIVAVAGNIWLRRFEPSPLRWAEKRLFTEGFLALARAFGRFPARLLGIGSEDVSREFAIDIGRWVRSDRFDARDGEDYLAGFARIRAPVLAVFGAGDRILCHPVAGARFHAALIAAPLETIVAGRPFLPFDPGHMALVTDPRARPLWDEVARWLARRLLCARA